MTVRFDYAKANPEAYNTMLKLEGFIKESGFDPTLYKLIKIRASQINGCALCLDMHTRELRAMGESEQRVHLISVWREVPFFTAKEKAVLELTEALALIANAGVPQRVYETAREHFSEQEFMTIIMAVNTISGWNRIAIATGQAPAQA